MKRELLEKYLNKTITVETIWGDQITGTLRIGKWNGQNSKRPWYRIADYFLRSNHIKKVVK